MGHPAPQTVSPPLVGGIHRVIRCAGVYLCGLCQQGYEDHSSAQSCLVECWETQLKLDPVVERQGPRHRVQYRCRFCARDYGSRAGAGQCATECRAHFRAKFEMESTFLASPARATQERRRARGPARITLVRVPLTSKPLKRRPKGADAASPAAQPQASSGGAAKSGEETSAPEAKVEAPEAKVEVPEAKEFRGDPSKPFSRDGAQYVCSRCNTKYFTKDEVVKCFESH